MLIRRLTRGISLLDNFVHHPGFRANPARAVGRLLMWRVRCWTHRPGVYAWPGYEGYRFVLPPVWASESTISYVFRPVRAPDRELTWLTRLLVPGNVVLDVGANLGQWTLPLALAVAPSGRVLAMEPSAATCAALRQTLTLNRLTQSEAIPVALSDRGGTIRLYHHTRDPSQHSLAAIGGHFESVRAMTLDDFTREQSITRLDAVKIDVEGAEELVLRGAVGTLAKWRPIVVFELVPGFAERLGLATGGPIHLLRDLGYQILELDAEGRERPVNDFDVSGHPVGANLIALHADR